MHDDDASVVPADESLLEDLLSQMTLDEKASLTGGKDFWRLNSIDRLSVGSVMVTDGPAGARGDGFPGAGDPSVLAPCGSALGATWNPGLVRSVAAVLARDARRKGAQVLLAPTVNLHRTPTGGRNFESYSEDPFLTAAMAVAYVSGVQDERVAACVKHYVCNDTEFERFTISSDVDERTLREVYLPPFEAAVRDAGSWSLMAAYNRVNGEYATEHRRLLLDVLRGEWGFDGVVVSDWGATHDTVAAALGGLDLEMPGSMQFGPALAQAVRDGRVDEGIVDDKARNVLRLVGRTGRLEVQATGEDTGENTGEDSMSATVDVMPDASAADARPTGDDRALLLEAAAESFVLLRNADDALPLDGVGRIAVVGPHAVTPVAQGGGSAHVTPHHVVTPLEGILSRAGEATEVVYEPGLPPGSPAAPIDRRLVTGPDGAPGFVAEFRNGTLFGGAPDTTVSGVGSRVAWFGDVHPDGVNGREFTVRLQGTLTPRHGGRHMIGVGGVGTVRLWVDGNLVADNEGRHGGSPLLDRPRPHDADAEVELQAGVAVEIVLDYTTDPDSGIAYVEVGLAPTVGEDGLDRAVAAAAGADAAVVVVGQEPQFECEGGDRENLSLPASASALVAAVSAATSRVVVVVNAGSPVELPWLDRVPATLWAGYPGQEYGDALAAVLFGDADPGGRLPVTFPRRLEDTPAFLHHPGEFGHAPYGEGLFVGHRWYDARRIDPLLPFGHGLSYTRFAYRGLEVTESAPIGHPVLAQVTVENVGTRRGVEVVQAYLEDNASGVRKPERTLVAFAKVALNAGETRVVDLWLTPRAFAHWDPERSEWATAPGPYDLVAGRSSGDLQVRGTVVVEDRGTEPAGAGY